jgi:hypothetical protein
MFGCFRCRYTTNYRADQNPAKSSFLKVDHPVLSWAPLPFGCWDWPSAIEQRGQGIAIRFGPSINGRVALHIHNAIRPSEIERPELSVAWRPDVQFHFRMSGVAETSCLRRTRPVHNRSAGGSKTFHNIGSAKRECSSKAKMSALSKVEMSVSAPFWEFGGCHFDGRGGDEQARAEPS